MTSWTDFIICIMLCIIGANGAYQGFLRSLTGPLCFVCGSLAGFLFYIKTKDLRIGLITSLLSTFLLTWLFNSIIQARFGDNSGLISVWGRIGGAAFNLLWGGSILITLLLVLTMAPLKEAGLTALYQDMDQSTTYHFIARMIVKKKPAGTAQPDCRTGLCSMDKKSQQDLAQDKDVQELMKDPRLQALINDPAAREAAEKKDIGKMLSNPAIRELTKDPDFMLKILKIYPKLQEQMGK